MNKDNYIDDDDQGHDDYIERQLDRADYLRDEQRDREFEAALDATEARHKLEKTNATTSQP